MTSSVPYFPSDIELLLQSRLDFDAAAFKSLTMANLERAGLVVAIDSDGSIDDARFHAMNEVWYRVVFGSLARETLGHWHKELFGDTSNDAHSGDATALRARYSHAELRFLGTWRDRLTQVRTALQLEDRVSEGALDFYAFVIVMVNYGHLFDVGPYVIYSFTREVSDIHVDGTTMTLIGAKGGAWRATVPSFATVDDQLRAADSYARLYGKRFDDGVGHENLSSTHFHRLALRRDTTIFAGYTGAYRIQLLDNPTPQSMVDTGYISLEAMHFLQRCVEAEVPIVVAGEAGSAKTTLLRALARSIGRNEPVLTVEESPELFLRMARDDHGRRFFSNVHDHIIQSSATGEVIGFADILKWALQESCRRMIVGEISSGEIMAQFLTALSGHGSGMATLHASDLDNVVPRITTLLSSYGVPSQTAWSQIQDNLGVVVHAQLQHNANGISRFVTGIGWVVPSPASADSPPKILNCFTRDDNGLLRLSAEAPRVIRNLLDAERRTKGAPGPAQLEPRLLAS